MKLVEIAVTVCEMSGDPSTLHSDWKALAQHTMAYQPDLVLLPEMPFYSWVSSFEEVDEDLWDKAVRAHHNWMDQLETLGATTVILTAPTGITDDLKTNEGIVWTKQGGSIRAHTKYYLPNEPGFWEENWYNRGTGKFEIIEINGLRIGFLICTELWFLGHARDYSKQGIDLLVCPRSTEKSTVDKWVTGGQVASVVSGAFCLSSNHHGLAPDNTTKLGGVGWITDPDGKLLATTSRKTPFVTLKIDIQKAKMAKSTYPRYVKD